LGKIRTRIMSIFSAPIVYAGGFSKVTVQGVTDMYHINMILLFQDEES
jgi:hypothetical protein